MGLLSTIGAASGRAFGFTRSAIAQAVSDAYFNLTTLLLPGNGTNGAQNNTFLDSGTANGGVGFNITRNPSTGPNAPTQGTFSPFSQTGWSGFFDGTGDYVTVANNADFQFGTGDFTVEYWVYFTSDPAGTSFFPLACWAANSGFELYYRGTSPAGFAWYYNSSVLTTGFVPVANRWYHVACTRASGTTRVFVDGAVQATLNSDTSNLSPTTALLLGAEAATTGTTFPGYISNVRVIKGAAAYTLAFTPSTSNLGIFGSGTTGLLTLQSNRFIDNGSNPKTVTPTNAAIQPFSPFAPTAAYSAATNGGSGYFDGTGDFLSSASTINFSNNDFTVEFWIYPTAASTQMPFCCATNNAIQIQLTASGGSLNASIGTYGVGNTITTTGAPIRLNQWNHVVAVRETLGTNGAAIFVNGSRNIIGIVGTTYVAGAIHVGGIPGGTQVVTGYLSGMVVTNGTANYSVSNTSITVPTAPPSSTGSTLCLNFTNAGIIDATAKNDLETVGGAQISTTQSKWGGSSMSFDGTGDYLFIPQSNNPLNMNWELVRGDFTIEFWFRANTVSPSFQGLIVKFDGDAASRSEIQFMIILAGNSLNCNAYQGVVNNDISFASAISINTWYHVAFVRSGNSFYAYLDGARNSTIKTIPGDLNSGTNWPLQIGRYTEGGVNYDFNGFIDDLRITKFARYSGATISVPAAAFQLS